MAFHAKGEMSSKLQNVIINQIQGRGYNRMHFFVCNQEDRLITGVCLYIKGSGLISGSLRYNF